MRKNLFDLSHDVKLSCDMGYLVPCLVEDVIPGDVWRGKSTVFARVAPLVAPIMHKVELFIHYFFVPYRLLMTNWQSFITGGPQGTDASTLPTMDWTNIAVGSLADYLGFPTGTGNSITVSAFPFRAYCKIYNEWYRDQTLQNELVISYADGNDSTTASGLQLRNWEKDYYTSCLPWAQRGTAVSLPLGTTAPVTLAGSQWMPGIVTNGGGTTYPTVAAGLVQDGVGNATGNLAASVNVGGATGTVNLSTATAATINDLRLAFAAQRFLERNARSGVRYPEFLMAHYQVMSSDARLQRPEYLGGGRMPFKISEVLQTSETSGTPQGTLAGHGYAVNQIPEFNRHIEEHGLIMGILSVLPRTAYQQGINRIWTKSTRYDFYTPEFAFLGAQAVLNKEIYAGDGTVADNTVFGYQDHWDEYRRRESSVHGDFRTSLDQWHCGRIFGSAPSLNSTFITADCSSIDNRIFAVPSGHNLWIQIAHDLKVLRPLPITGEPGMVDHSYGGI